ncbi:MAG TPA: UPF0182 family protein [Nocardioides sp.]|uniref:UPF0182 family membrane protein n=1 Tax=Nocardioides sp. TaxID=35761 RepID=UPI002C4CE6AA|nr:UPF0182 family protein [Nocardioides sp.]HQR27701.1 UPF0182 family protein [Nocardioides sp.]
MSGFFDDEVEAADHEPAGSAPRRSRALLWTAVVLAGLFVAFTGFSSFWTERLWFESVGYGGVFSTLIWTRILLFLVFGTLVAAVVAANMLLAYRLRPMFRPASPEQVSLDRYRDVVAPRRVWLVAGIATVVGIFAGASAAGEWRAFLLWRNSVSFGREDPYFKRDLGFYVFELPWLHYLVELVMVVTVVALIAAGLVHYLFGGIRLQNKRDRFSPGAQAQLSALVGVFVLAKAVGYWLGRFDLLTQKHALFTGVNYTADHAVLPARNILTGIALICAILFFLNVWRRTWLLPSVGLALLVLSAVLLGMIWPGVVQRFQVDPSEADKEAPYIQANIEATRAAYNLEDTVVEPYSGISPLPDTELARAALNTPGIRLIDPRLVQPIFEQKQQVRGYYSVAPVLDVDRYDIPPGDGKAPIERDLVLGVRELDQAGLPENSKNWANLHTVYTHGYGMIAAYGNQKAADNALQVTGDEPAWAEKDIPPQGQLTDLTPDGYEGRIYFGEKSPDYSVVGKVAADSPDIELDLPGGSDEGSAESTTTYDGKAGVDIGNLFHKVLFAMRFGDGNLVLSGRVHENSKILFHRNPREMVEKVAPWLTVDEDPFPAVVDGRVVWMLDGYTATDRYPLSQLGSFEDMTTDSLAQNTTFQTLPTDEINYMRNAVKATVDAYDGTVKLYAWDESDPILKAWTKAFPGTVLQRSEIPEDVLAHMRYPEDLFKVQRYQLASYHVTDPNDFYERNDQWEVPLDPDKQTSLQPPYRLTVQTPSGDEVPTFSLTSVYVPAKRDNLAAFLSADAAADQDGYGTLRVLRLPSTSQIPGPGQIANLFAANDEIQNELVAFTRTNSKAVYGNLLTLPVGGGLLYVQPLYALKEQSTASYPVLKFVLVSLGSRSGIGTTLGEAINDVLDIAPSETPSRPPGGGGDGGGGGQGGEEQPTGSKAVQIRRLLNAADVLFAEADNALRAGNLEQYAAKVAAARDKIEQALTLANQTKEPAKP